MIWPNLAFFLSVQVNTKMLAKPSDVPTGGNASAAPPCALDGTPLPNVVQYIKDGKVDLVINIPEVGYDWLIHDLC